MDNTVATDGMYSLNINNSSFLSNSTSHALLIDIGRSSATINNSTFASNSIGSSTGSAAVIDINALSSTLTLTHVTVVNNSGGAGRTDAAAIRSFAAFMNIRNSIIYGNNHGGGDCTGNVARVSNSIIGNGSSPTCRRNALTDDPKLGSLVTPTDGKPPYFPLTSSSPAIGKGRSPHCTAKDQIGNSRPTDFCDLGAIENLLTTPATTVPPTPVPPTTVPPTPAPTDTPDGDPVLFELGSFQVTYSMIYGSGDPIADYHPGFTEEGLSNLINEMGVLVGAGWSAARNLSQYVVSQVVCGAATAFSLLAVDLGGIDVITNLLFDLNFWRILGAAKGFVFGGKSGAVAGSVVPIAGTAAGGLSVGAIAAYLGPELATRVGVFLVAQAAKLAKTAILKTASGFIKLALDEGSALGKKLKQAVEGAEIGATLLIEIAADALFESVVGYVEEAAIDYRTWGRGSKIFNPHRFATSVKNSFPGNFKEAALSIGVAARALAITVGEIGITHFLENMVVDIVENIKNGLDCDSLEPVRQAKAAASQFITALGDGAEIIITELGDDIRYWIWVIKDKINTMTRLINQLRNMESFNIQEIHKSICGVSEFREMFPVSTFCSPVVSSLIADAICVFGEDMTDVTDDAGNTLGALDCDDLKNQYPEPVEDFLLTTKHAMKWVCKRGGIAVPGSCLVAIGIQLFASPGQGWKEYIVRGNSFQLNTNHLPRWASGFRLRIRALNGVLASEPVLYPADPNDPTLFAAQPAIIIHENVPEAPSGEDGGGEGEFIGGARPETTPFSTCENLPANFAVFDYNLSTQCNVVTGGGIGHSDLAGRFSAALDVWGWLDAGVEVCIQGSGRLMFIDTGVLPRTVGELMAYSDGGMTCASINRPGQVVLMPGPPAPPRPTPKPPTTPLYDCMVRLNDILKFREEPGGAVKTSDGGQEFWLPYNVVLTAFERTDGWFYVDYHGERGWISADYVEPAQGNCDDGRAPAPTLAAPVRWSTPTPTALPVIVGQPLTNCSVKLLYALNFRTAPYAGAEVLFVLPYNVTLTGVERYKNWIKVDWYGEKGWVAVDYVELSEGCEPTPEPPQVQVQATPKPGITPVGWR